MANTLFTLPWQGLGKDFFVQDFKIYVKVLQEKHEEDRGR